MTVNRQEDQPVLVYRSGAKSPTSRDSDLSRLSVPAEDDYSMLLAVV